MDFVVQVLMEIFNKRKEEAVMLMMMVHKGGKAVVGMYSYDIALTKIRLVTALAEEMCIRDSSMCGRNISKEPRRRQ